MERTRAWLIGLAVAVSMGAAAPTTPTYIAVETAIARVEKDWAKPGVNPDPNMPGWNAMFSAIRQELGAYTTAKTDEDRVRSLNRLYQIAAALDAIAWAPAVEIRDELRNWLRPRLTLYWAGRQIVDMVRGLPANSDATTRTNGDKWVKFVADDLGAALNDYEKAADVRKRSEAMVRIQKALTGLSTRNQEVSWGPAVNLQSAVVELYNGPNLSAMADAATVSRKLANHVVETGPVYRKGQTSYVTAGPYMGFGLMYSDDGIMFYNRQALSSVTPINGFNQQVASDPKGQRATKLYQFNATSTDQGVLTIIAVLKPTGLQLYPQSTHNTDAAICAAPQPGKGFARGVASLIGMGRNKITQKVYEGAIGQIRSSVEQESREEAAERAAARSAATDAQIRNLFTTPDTLTVKNFEVGGVHLRSRPQFILVDGQLKWKGAPDQIGAEMPKPSKFNNADAGISADIHLPSILTNVVRGQFQNENVKTTQNLLIETRKVPAGTPMKDALTITPNADFPALQKAIETARAANDPKVLALRLKRPDRSPDFAVDRNGLLVAIIHDFTVEVPAPEAAAKGGISGPPAKIYRVVAPNAELLISFTIIPATGDSPVRLSGKIEGFEPGPGAKVFAIVDDESKAVSLTALTGNLVLGVFAGKIKGQPLDIPLAVLNMPAFHLDGASAVDPTGWMRINLTPVTK